MGGSDNRNSRAALAFEEPAVGIAQPVTKVSKPMTEEQFQKKRDTQVAALKAAEQG